MSSAAVLDNLEHKFGKASFRHYGRNRTVRAPDSIGWEFSDRESAEDHVHQIVDLFHGHHQYLGRDRGVPGIEIHNFKSCHNGKKISVYKATSVNNGVEKYTAVVTHK